MVRYRSDIEWLYMYVHNLKTFWCPLPSYCLPKSSQWSPLSQPKNFTGSWCLATTVQMILFKLATLIQKSFILCILKTYLRVLLHVFWCLCKSSLLHLLTYIDLQNKQKKKHLSKGRTEWPQLRFKLKIIYFDHANSWHNHWATVLSMKNKSNVSIEVIDNIITRPTGWILQLLSQTLYHPEKHNEEKVWSKGWTYSKNYKLILQNPFNWQWY